MLRVYAIGDIHGSLRALCRLIAECERDADETADKVGLHWRLHRQASP